MNTILKTALATAGLALASQAAAQITFYEHDSFQGRNFTTQRQVGDFARFGFNDRASSAVVTRDRWEVCQDSNFGGRCMVLRPGHYDSFGAMGLNDRISSVRNLSRNAHVQDSRYAPAPVVASRDNGKAQITFFEHDGFQGRNFTTERQIGDFARFGFNDRASSAVVTRDRWEVCQDARFGGRCMVLRPGRYNSFGAMGLNDRISSVRKVSRNTRVEDRRYAPAPVVVGRDNGTAQITFFEHDGFQGRNFTTERQVDDFARFGFNDRASSAVVTNDQWEVCQDARFGGRCMVLRPGRYESFGAMGLNDRISSVRNVSSNVRVENNRFAPAPMPAYDARRRGNERLFEANVTSVRAVVWQAEQRCWIEREQVYQDRGNANVPGAIVGALIGGILGHQVGNGRGNDVATVVGAVGGAAFGANVDRDGQGQQGYSQDVQRCSSVPSQARPSYWDVTYDFRGQAYRVQTSAPPGPTVTVNGQGEPRVH